MEESRQLKGVTGGLAMLSPLIPIVLVAFLKVPVCPAFTVGIIWALVFTSKSFKKAMNMLTKTCYDGITDAGPAVILMVLTKPPLIRSHTVGSSTGVYSCTSSMDK